MFGQGRWENIDPHSMDYEKKTGWPSQRKLAKKRLVDVGPDYYADVVDDKK